MRLQRTLAPTAAPISLRRLVPALSGIWGGTTYRDRIIQELKSTFSAHGVFLVSSGKGALTVILKALAAGSTRRRVVIPAYTCFSVPSAVIKAGLEVVLCDVDPETLDFKFDELETLLNEQALCVLPTHLFGFSADVDRVKRLCEGRGIVVVEDAAQAMGARVGDRLVGTLGDSAFFSLGRGKNLTSGTGGIILTRSSRLTDAIQAEYSRLRQPSGGEVVRNWMELVIMRCFIHPALYWFPAGLPFLGLGETKFYTDFPIFRMDEVRARQLDGWVRQLTEANRGRIVRANRLVERLQPHSRKAKPIIHSQGVYLRLPVLMRDREAKDTVCTLSRESGAGISPNYPTTIQEIPELAGRIRHRTCPGAQEIVDRLVTLPTHRFVTERDSQKLDCILRDTAAGPVPHSGENISAGEASAGRSCSMPMK
jgi:dTDP-4-amino-4,6-dideoxygalactose transaminase